jgi:hypothetical protein
MLSKKQSLADESARGEAKTGDVKPCKPQTDKQSEAEWAGLRSASVVAKRVPLALGNAHSTARRSSP